MPPPILPLLLAALALPSPSPPAPAERALWVTRFDYRSRADVLQIVADCRAAGVDTILFQVRGNATAGYRSAYEPWLEQLGGRAPDCDPLEVVLEAAHAAGLRVKAWFNVLPVWWGTKPPADPSQLYHQRKDWLWYDAEGRAQPLAADFYVSLNPCLPEVRRYLAAVARDLARRYAIDGLHLDYIRFPNDLVRGVDYPRDARTLELFAAETGRTPDADRAAWDAWRARQVTEVVRALRAAVHEARPGLEISAAVGPEPERALEHHFQDVRAWLAQGLVDLVYPMNYTAERERFELRCAGWRELAADRVVMGLRLTSPDPALCRAQLEHSLRSFRGYALFAYSSLFDSPNTTIDRQDEQARVERAERREALLPVLRAVR